MVTINISRAGASLGAFPESEVREGLRSGRFFASDLGWREGMSTWQPLSTFPDLASELPPAAAGIAPIPGAVVIARDGLPWEHRAELGTVQAFIETAKLVLFQPAVAFSRMKTEGGMSDPLIYALLGGGLGLVCYFLIMLVVQSVGFMSSRNNPLGHLFGFGIGMVFAFLLIPVFVIVGVFIGSILLHLCLMLVGGAKRSFETTLRVVCYTCGSTNLLLIIPFCGGVIAAIWGIVAECIGLARAHETETGRAVLAVFLPVVICCGGGFLMAVFFGTLGAVLGHH
ncbi:MAG: YIP1 family protein [Chthoniobacterales bacterium]